MDLMTVFTIIVVSILLLIFILWLLSVLLGSRMKEDEAAVILGTAKVVVVKPKKPVASHEPTPAQVKKAPPPEPDDLKVIEGIGPKIEGLLHDSGIVTFAQLASTPVINLQVILMEADLRIENPGNWPEQAALAAKGQWDALQKLQDEHKGGRKVD